MGITMENTETQCENLTTEQWSKVLVEALPYFKNWCGKVVVVKYGGNAMLNEELKQAVMEDIAVLTGGKVVSKELGINIKECNLQILGIAEKCKSKQRLYPYYKRTW